MIKLLTILMMGALVAPSVLAGQDINQRPRLGATSRAASDSRHQEERAKTDGTIDRGRAAVLAGMAAPNFTLRDTSGRPVSLESLRGKVVLINFWATWCPYCVEDMPLLDQLQQEFGKQGLVVLGINVEDADTAREFMQEHRYKFTTLIDPNSDVSTLYQVEALPSIFIIGKDGEVVRRFQGLKSKSTLREAIASAGIKNSSRDA